MSRFLRYLQNVGGGDSKKNSNIDVGCCLGFKLI